MITLLQTLVVRYRLWRTARAYRWLEKQHKRIMKGGSLNTSGHPDWVVAHVRAMDLGLKAPGVHVTDDAQQPDVTKQPL